MTAMLLLTAILAQECVISGRVYSLTSGMALRKVDVRLVGPGVNAKLSGVRNTTDPDGAFRFDHLSSGDYRLFAERNGYLNAPVQRASCGATDVTIKMSPQGMIFGNVMDEDGEPEVAQVILYRRLWVHGRRELDMLNITVSQADGSFVLGNIAAGPYFLSAKGTGRIQRGERFVENFFPDIPDPQAAQAVNVTGGADLHGVDLLVRAVRTHSVRGKVSGSPSLLQLQNIGAMNHVGILNTSPQTDGTFEFAGVAPGDWVLSADAIPMGSPLSVRIPVRVEERDVEGVSVTLLPPMRNTGTVNLDEAPFSGALRVALESKAFPSAFRGGPNAVAEIRDGAFEISAAHPTHYRVSIEGPPDGYCIKSMRFNQSELAGADLDLSSGAGGILNIDLSSKPGTIGGTARNSNGDPVSDAVVTVWATNDLNVRPVRTDAAGHFQLRNFAPGEYRVIAWESIEWGVVENLQFRAHFEDQAMAVTLQEGSQQNVELKPIPKTVSDAEIARLP